MSFAEYLGENLWQILEAIGALVAAIAALFALVQARKIFRQQSKMAQRHSFFDVFEQFSRIKSVDPANPIWPDVRSLANFLDLIGIAWEAEIVDEQVIFRMFREIVIVSYEAVMRCTNPPPGYPDGPTMLKNSKSATSLYEHLLEQEKQRDMPQPLFRR